jgi:hypothetical protein
MNQNQQELQVAQSDVVFVRSARLRTEFDAICKEKNVYHGLGPATAYFQTPEPGIKRYVYVTFGMGGVKPEGHASATHPDEAVVIRESVKVFREWLQPNRTLVWRVRPEVDSLDGRWASYWRCVQLDDDAKENTIEWSL